MSTAMTPEPPARGRPRDPALDQRILDAALRVYAERGAGGFTIQNVAREAQCSRPAIDARWSTRADLLLAAVRSFDASLDVPDEGTTREQLVLLTQQLMDGFADYRGMATFRIVFDSLSDDRLHAEWEAINQTRLASISSVLQRGLERGDLPPVVTDPEFMLSLSGAALIRGLYGHLGPVPLPASSGSDATRLVDFLLR